MSEWGLPPLPGFKSWAAPLLIRYKALPTFHELVEADRNLQRWARALTCAKANGNGVSLSKGLWSTGDNGIRSANTIELHA